MNSEPTESTFFFFQAEDGIRDLIVTGVQTCALPILALVIEGERMDAWREAGQGGAGARIRRNIDRGPGFADLGTEALQAGPQELELEVEAHLETPHVTATQVLRLAEVAVRGGDGAQAVRVEAAEGVVVVPDGIIDERGEVLVEASDAEVARVAEVLVDGDVVGIGAPRA